MNTWLSCGLCCGWVRALGQICGFRMNRGARASPKQALRFSCVSQVSTLIPLENTHNHRPQIGPYGCPKSSQWLLHYLFLKTILSSPTSFSPDNLLASCLVFLRKPQVMRRYVVHTPPSPLPTTWPSTLISSWNFLINFPCFHLTASKQLCFLTWP